ncbi:MAG: GNAT family N-acetyltransferase [Parvibaculum sp.]
MKPVLQTPRLILKPTVAGDQTRIACLLRLPEVRRYLCDDLVFLNERISDILANSDAHEPRDLGLWAIEAMDGTFLGIVGIHDVSEVFANVEGMAGEVDVVVALDPAAFGRGYAVEALTAMINHAVALGRRHLVGAVDAPNVASHRMMERAGFVRFGECDGPCHRQVLYRWTHG